MDLDDELRRIFTDDRLDVAVQPGAEERIVAGARRVRVRRRLAVTGATGGVAVAALVAGTVLFTDPSPPDAMPPAERTQISLSTSAPSGSSSAASATSQNPLPPSSGGTGRPGPDDDPATTAETRVQPPAVTGAQIGPTGFGVVYLGMSFDEAVAANATEGAPPTADGGCGQYPLLLDGEPAGYLHFTVNGLEAIGPTVDRHTADGVSLGWTVAQAKTVYPSIDEGEVAEYGRQLVSVPGNSGAVYRLQFADDAVTMISLQTVNQPCYE
jgi:hypothetical protein